MDIKDPRIDTYLNGEMTSEEMSQFEVEAKQFPTVWEHIQFQQFIINHTLLVLPNTEQKLRSMNIRLCH